jgi:hypothetical protein
LQLCIYRVVAASKAAKQFSKAFSSVSLLRAAALQHQLFKTTKQPIEQPVRSLLTRLSSTSAAINYTTQHMDGCRRAWS